MAEGGILLEHLLIVFVELQLGKMAIVEGELQLVVVAGDDKVGDDIVGMRRLALSHTRLGVKAANALDSGVELLLVEL